MSTDDEIRNAFHSALGGALADLTVDPGTLSVVRRRHARQQRMLAVGAPLGVAVITAGAVIGATAVHPSDIGGNISALGDDGTPSPSPSPSDTATVEPLQTIGLLDHTFAVPSDWTLSGNRKLIDLTTIQPPQPVGGKDQSVTATSPDGSQQISATIYEGEIAGAEQGSVGHGSDVTTTTIDNKQVTIHYYGSPGADTECIRIGGSSTKHRRLVESKHRAEHRQGGGASKYVTVPCTVKDQRPQADVGIEYADGDFENVDTVGLTESQIEAFLTAALAGHG